MPANPLACVRHIDDQGGCRLTAERSDLMAQPKAREPKVAKPGKDGIIDPVCEIDEGLLRVHLARVVHPKDLKRAVKRVTQVNGLRPIRPASQVCSGKSILEMLWEELDAIVERIMADGAGPEQYEKGQAIGVAFCIATIENPYLPDIERVRERAMARWEAGQ